MESKTIYFDNLGFAYEEAKECSKYDNLTEFELCESEGDGEWWMHRYLLPSVVQDSDRLELTLRLEQGNDEADIMFRVCIRLTDEGFSFDVYEKHSAYFYKENPEDPSINPDGFTFQWVYNDDAATMLEWYSKANLSKDLSNETVVAIGRYLAEITYNNRRPYDEYETLAK